MMLDRPPGFPPDWKTYTPLEVRVLALLLDRGPLTDGGLTFHLPADTRPDAIAATLAGLLERRVLAATPGGYAVNLDDPQDRATFREWLAEEEGKEAQS